MSTKPREFWIEKKKFKDNKVSFNEVRFCRPVIESCFIHVIEHSAYQALEQKFEKATSLIEQDTIAIKSLRQKLAVAVEKFKQIDNTSDCKFALEIAEEALALINADPMIKSAQDTIEAIRELYKPDAQKSETEP